MKLADRLLDYAPGKPFYRIVVSMYHEARITNWPISMTPYGEHEASIEI